MNQVHRSLPDLMLGVMSGRVLDLENHNDRLAVGPIMNGYQQTQPAGEEKVSLDSQESDVGSHCDSRGHTLTRMGGQEHGQTVSHTNACPIRKIPRRSMCPGNTQSWLRHSGRLGSEV